MAGRQILGSQKTAQEVSLGLRAKSSGDTGQAGRPLRGAGPSGSISLHDPLLCPQARSHPLCAPLGLVCAKNTGRLSLDHLVRAQLS